MRHIVPAFSHLWKNACANRATCTPRRTRCKSGITRPLRRMRFTLFTTSLAFRRARQSSTSILFSQCLRISPCTVPFLPGAHASFWSTSAELAYAARMCLEKIGWWNYGDVVCYYVSVSDSASWKDWVKQNREVCVSSSSSAIFFDFLLLRHET